MSRIVVLAERCGELRRRVVAELGAAGAAAGEVTVRIDPALLPTAARLNGYQNAPIGAERRHGIVERHLLVVVDHHPERAQPAARDGLDRPWPATLAEF